jgi:hypothetical protein
MFERSERTEIVPFAFLTDKVFIANISISNLFSSSTLRYVCGMNHHLYFTTDIRATVNTVFCNSLLLHNEKTRIVLTGFIFACSSLDYLRTHRAGQTRRSPPTICRFESPNSSTIRQQAQSSTTPWKTTISTCNLLRHRILAIRWTMIKRTNEREQKRLFEIKISLCDS